MIWYGQYNAILILLLGTSILISILAGNFGIAFIALLFVVTVRVCATFINLIFSAFTGFPLIYDTKIQMSEARNQRAKLD